jgi:hypothetical protein
VETLIRICKIHKICIFVDGFCTPNLSAMQPTKTTQDEILALEAEISHQKNLLDKSIKDDDVLEKTKAIFHELKVLTDKLAQLKKNMLSKA